MTIKKMIGIFLATAIVAVSAFAQTIVVTPDALYVSVSGNHTVPTTKDQCKNGGWKNHIRTDGSLFKNQGDCIQFVNTGR